MRMGLILVPWLSGSFHLRPFELPWPTEDLGGNMAWKTNTPRSSSSRGEIR